MRNDVVPTDPNDLLKLASTFIHVMQAGLERKDPVLPVHCNEQVGVFVKHQLDNSKLDKTFSIFYGTHPGCVPMECTVDNSLLLFSREPQSSELTICFSGGIDSTLAVIWALHVYHFKKIALVFVDYGSEYNAFEFLAAQNLALYFDSYTWGKSFVTFQSVHTGDKLDSSKFGAGYIIPMRNAIIGTIGAMSGQLVWQAANWRAQIGGGVSDKSIEFYCTLSDICSSYARRPRIITSPFLHMSKQDVISAVCTLIGANETKKIIKQTVSCYTPKDGKHCGRCYSCWKRMKVLQHNMWFNPQDFAEDPSTMPANLLTAYQTRESSKGR